LDLASGRNRAPHHLGRDAVRGSLEVFVGTIANTPFEPAGMTDDLDVQLAQALMDYVFCQWPFSTSSWIGTASRSHAPHERLVHVAIREDWRTRLEFDHLSAI
jgi:hypothetical protein